jgi:hypothetical protein
MANVKSEVRGPVRLEQLVRELGEFGDELVLFAPAGSAVTSQTSIYLIDEEAEEPPAGTDYLLEVRTLKNVLKVWSAWRNGAKPTTEQACEAVLWYADHDAYQPVDSRG